MTMEIWYYQDQFSRDTINAEFFQAQTPFDPKNLSATHVFVRTIEATNHDTAYMHQQGENWSPNGEARSLIRSLGISHTSMSIGDIIVEANGTAFMVDTFGFAEIQGRK